jgi:hypothetical protein
MTVWGSQLSVRDTEAIRHRQADQDRYVKPKLGPPKGRPMNAALAEQLRRQLLAAFRLW